MFLEFNANRLGILSMVHGPYLDHMSICFRQNTDFFGTNLWFRNYYMFNPFFFSLIDKNLKF